MVIRRGECLLSFNWTDETIEQLIYLKEEKKLTFDEIAKTLGTTLSSVKHKYQRISQKKNNDKYHHPYEKTEQILRLLTENNLTILETHAGWGNITKVYSQFGNVVAQEIDKEKVEHLMNFNCEEINAIKCDSEKEVFNHIALKRRFDVIDIDPYGFPSRFFPHVFKLFNKKGLLFLTFPKMGVAQINKIMIRHYKVFWNIELTDKEIYVEKIAAKLHDFAFMEKRKIEILETLDLGKVYRFAILVEEASMLDLVGLKVKGVNY